MVNLYDKHRFISKSTLARLADVSPRTFSRYLQTRRPILDAMGVSPKAQKLPPQAVRYICEDYCIDLPPELQDRESRERIQAGSRLTKTEKKSSVSAIFCLSLSPCGERFGEERIFFGSFLFEKK